MNPQRHGPRIGPRKTERKSGRPRVSTCSGDPNDGFIAPMLEPVRSPRLTVRCVYPGAPTRPTEVTFNLSSSYEIRTGVDAHGWFRRMMREHETFEVETDRPGGPRLWFWSNTVQRVMVE